MATKKAPRGRCLRVLIVEDEAMLAIGLEAVVVASVGRLDKALAAARDTAFDLGILDLNIRGQETYAVAELLEGRGIPFIFATGYEPARLRAPYRDGLVLQKPYTQSDLREMIGAAFA
jgi:CheY-like chemotaxis protein